MGKMHTYSIINTTKYIYPVPSELTYFGVKISPILLSLKEKTCSQTDKINNLFSGDVGKVSCTKRSKE